MTPEQMRELADELDKYVGSPTRASYYPSPVLRAADFLRQCAEQRPDGWKLVPVEPTPEMLSAVGMMDGYDWHAPGCSPDADHATWYSAMIAAAPAAPQAEPIDPHMIAAEDRFPDVPAERWKPCPQCGGDFDRECPICDGLGRVLATDGEQAEPKRDQPLLDLLAVIHCDGGHHTEAVGLDQSIKDAQVAVSDLKKSLALGGSDAE